MKRVSLACLLAVLLSACSGVKLFYSQLDWLVPHYVEGYVALTERQSTLLEQRLRELLAWHCNTQLPRYAEWLRQVDADVQGGDLSYARLEAHAALLRSHWRILMKKASEGTADLLLTASDTQVQELFRNLEKKNRVLRAEHADAGSMKWRVERARQFEQQFERWFGGITPTQHDLVVAWSKEVVPTDTARLAARERWQAELRRLLRQRADTPAFRSRVRTLLIHPERIRSPAYGERFGVNRRRTLELLVALGAQLTVEQRAYFGGRITSWARDFDELACIDPRREKVRNAGAT